MGCIIKIGNQSVSETDFLNHLNKIINIRDTLDTSPDKEYVALNKRDSSNPLTEYVVFDANKIKSLFNDGKYSKSENIYYHKNKNFKVNSEDYKYFIRQQMYKEVVEDNGFVSKDKKVQGKRTIKHIEKGESRQPNKVTSDKRAATVKFHLSRLNSINNREAIGGIKPFIINELKPSIEGKVKIPNYTVEVNEEYLEVEWERFKHVNNISDQEADNNLHGQFEQTKLDFGSDEQRANDFDLEYDNPKDLADKLDSLQKSFNNVRVMYNTGLPANVYGRLVTKPNELPSVEINPKYVRKDTAIHEFGHLYIDLLGGMSNKFVQRGRKLLEGSKIEEEVIKTYAGDISGELLDKEILATAIGREGAKLYDSQKDSPFKTWIKVMLNKLRLSLGLKGNVALELANRMLNNNVDQSTLTSPLSEVVQYSKTMGTEEFSSSEDNQVTLLADKVKSRINILQAKYTKETNNTKAQKFKDEIKKLAGVLEFHRDLKGLIRYTDEIENQSERIEARLSKLRSELSTNPSLDITDSIKQIGIFLGAFDLINDVERLYKDLKQFPPKDLDKNTLDLLNNLEIEEKLNKANTIRTGLNQSYDNLRRNALLELLAPKSKKIHLKYQTEIFPKQFYEQYGGRVEAKKQLGKNLLNEKNKYVASKMAEYSQQLQDQEKIYLEKLLLTAPKDIEFGVVGAFSTSPRSMSDELIQYTIELLDAADYRAMRQFFEEKEKALELHQELRKAQGNPSNQEKLYEGIYEVINGKKTGHLVGKYLSSFKEKQREFVDSFQGESPTKAHWKAFFKRESKNFINPQWEAMMKLSKDNPKRKVYEYLVEESKKKDAMVPDGYKLSIRMDDKYPTFRIPNIEKGTMETLYSNGLFTSISMKARDTFTRTSSDTEFGELPIEDDLHFKNVLVNESGKENHTVPIYFRQNMSTRDLNKQSYDLLGVHLMDTNKILNYYEKSKVGGTLELIAEQAGARNVIKREFGKTLINGIMRNEKVPVDIPGDQSQIFKVINSIIEDRLYGISSINAGSIKIGNKTININKAADGMLAWTGHTMLMFNYLSAGVNIMQGKYQNFLESVGGSIYSKDNVRNAEKIWWKYSIKVVGDIGEEVPKSKTNLLIERFNAFADFSGLNFALAEDSKVKRLASTSAGHFLNHSSESYIQGTLMYAVLDSIKVKSKGKEIPLHEAYELKDGKLVANVDLSNEELSKLEEEVSRKVQRTIEQLHGNYNKNNQAMAQRYVAGKFGYLMRKWMVPGIQRRWRGLQYATKGTERAIEDISYDVITDEDLEGYYTTTIRFLYAVRNELKTMQLSLISAQWNELTDEERGKIRKTIVDASAIVLTLMAAGLLAGLAEDADDEDKEMYYTMAYLFRRQYSEIFFYSNPIEGIRILSTPSASISMIEKTNDIIQQLFDPTEVYLKGKHKGESKLLRKIGKVSPVYSQLDRDIRDVYSWLVQ